MKVNTLLALSLLAALGQAQSLERVYNRDTHADFTLKKASTVSTVKGPIVKQVTEYTFDNPFEKLTEASVWFELPWAAVLNGFGYWYKDEYVPGVLMDRQKAWFIYTAITSRNEDPGIMVQNSPTSYHAQIYPLAKGYDFHLKLAQVGFLTREYDDLYVPQPSAFQDIVPSQSVVCAQPGLIEQLGTPVEPKFRVNFPKNQELLDVNIYAQKFKDGYTYVAGILRTDQPDAKLKVTGLHDVKWTRTCEGTDDGRVKLFVGRRQGAGNLSIASRPKGASPKVFSKTIKASENGPEAAQLWAHRMLVENQFRHSAELLKFSLKYQVPSSQTALLAVPQEQMKLFKAKEAEFRRQQAIEARKQRAWQRQRKMSWQHSSGGDPEIRVSMPWAVRAYAILPDGHQFNLVKQTDGYWGGNYDIPADAPDGTYEVRVCGVHADGTITEEKLSYQVDRTIPKGALVKDGEWLVLRTDKKLDRAVVVYGDGSEQTMIMAEPTFYKVPVDLRRIVKVVLIDQSHNLGEATWSASR